MIAAGVAAFARVVAGGASTWGFTPSPARTYVFFANHTSHADFVLIWSQLPADLRGRTRPVAARDYWSSSAARRYFARSVFRAELIDRTPDPTDPRPIGARVVAQMSASLVDGQSLILFPEGTRGDEALPAEFRSGLYHLWRDNRGVVFVPVYLRNLNKVLPKGSLIPVPISTTTSFGAPLDIAADTDKATFLTIARDAVVELAL